MTLFKGKRILITGACGSVGSELIRLLLADNRYGPDEVIGIDNHESNLFFQDQVYINERRAQFFVADVRDRDALTRHFRDVDIVFHAAALKHVILSERSPDEAIQTNILGVQNLISAAAANNVSRAIFTSSDKAVNPTSVMGTSKLMGERLFTAANSNKRDDGPIFSSTRFGNVLGSSGSVVPIFHNQIASGGPLTLTDLGMSRFVMTVEDAVRLVLESAELAHGGEVFITKMNVFRIHDLATAMIEMLAPLYGFDARDIEISVIGTKPGEKLYEELMSEEETRRSIELSSYFAVLPAFRGIYNDIRYEYHEQISTELSRPYISSEERPASIDEIKQFLESNDLLRKPGEDTALRYWPGDKEERS